jgi:hypothetical protein
MDVKLVDARRPKVAKPTAAHKEERLIPYKPDVRSPLLLSAHCRILSCSCNGMFIRLHLRLAHLHTAARAVPVTLAYLLTCDSSVQSIMQ